LAFRTGAACKAPRVRSAFPNRAASRDQCADLGFRADDESFATLWAGPTALNLTTESGDGAHFWGRAIFHVTDVDAFHEICIKAGHAPEFAPRDAPWMERYFHMRDPDGHELSFMTPLPGKTYPFSG
jgi:hypothetical protein